MKDEWISGFRWGVALTCAAFIVFGLLRLWVDVASVRLPVLAPVGGHHSKR